MPALPRHRDPRRAGPDDAGDTNAGAGTEHHLGGMGHGIAAADPLQLVRAQMRQRYSEGFKIVEDEDVVETSGAARLFGGEDPGGIGDLDFFAGDRSRHRHGAMTRNLLQALEIELGGTGDALMVGTDILLDLRKLQTFEINQGKAGIAAANIGDQCWSWDAVFRHSHSLVTRFSIGREARHQREGSAG